jgi:glucose-1-phosphate cytidylyltransferase
MKVVLLAGGFGSRISEETDLKPKPMIEIGGKPILWHIMKIYSHYGFNDFIICLGYRGYYIKEYFANYFRHMSDITYDMRTNTEHFHDTRSEPWRVTLVETGENTMTGGRVKAIGRFLEEDEHFCLTYGDGVADIDIRRLVDFHHAHGKLATVTAVKPSGRFGALEIGDSGQVKSFIEKPQGDGSYINGGFFVMNRKALEYIDSSQTVLEREPLEGLARDGQLVAYRHSGFWQPMDTLRDKNHLMKLWEDGAPWKVWQDNGNICV